MTDTRAASAPDPAFTTAALDEWSSNVDAILRGISHSLNNRASAIAAAIQLARDPADRADVVGAVLEPELARITELVAAVQAIAAPKRAAEAFAPRDAASEAAAILAFHAEQRDRGVAIDVPALSPLRTQRWMFVRALISLAARSSGAPVTVRDDGDAVIVFADGAARASVYARELATAMGGAPLNGPRAGFRIPTLEALRQREGR